MVTFGFLPQNFGKVGGSTNGTLSLHECRLSGGARKHLAHAPRSVINRLRPTKLKVMTTGKVIMKALLAQSEP